MKSVEGLELRPSLRTLVAVLAAFAVSPPVTANDAHARRRKSTRTPKGNRRSRLSGTEQLTKTTVLASPSSCSSLMVFLAGCAEHDDVQQGVALAYPRSPACAWNDLKTTHLSTLLLVLLDRVVLVFQLDLFTLFFGLFENKCFDVRLFIILVLIRFVLDGLGSGGRLFVLSAIRAEHAFSLSCPPSYEEAPQPLTFLDFLPLSAVLFLFLVIGGFSSMMNPRSEEM